jgi:hypothetical protein
MRVLIPQVKINLSHTEKFQMFQGQMQFFWQWLGLNLEPHIGQAGTLPLEPVCQPHRIL